MNLFRISFLLYFLKLLYGSRFYILQFKPPPPFIKGGKGVHFGKLKIDENRGGVWKFLLEKKGEVSQNGEESRNGGCQSMLKFIWRFLMMRHRKRILMCLSLTNVLQNNCVSKIRDDWHCNCFSSVDSYNSVLINCLCKQQAFYLISLSFL